MIYFIICFYSTRNIWQAKLKLMARWPLFGQPCTFFYISFLPSSLAPFFKASQHKSERDYNCAELFLVYSQPRFTLKVPSHSSVSHHKIICFTVSDPITERSLSPCMLKTMTVGSTGPWLSSFSSHNRVPKL